MQDGVYDENEKIKESTLCSADRYPTHGPVTNAFSRVVPVYCSFASHCKHTFNRISSLTGLAEQVQPLDEPTIFLGGAWS